VRDLRYAREETPRQVLDVQAEKVQESLHGALVNWARTEGEGSDYVDNLPDQCIHPVGHWYEVPNLLRNGVLRGLLAERPQLQYLMMHNIDTVGAHLDPVSYNEARTGRGPMTTHLVIDATRPVEKEFEKRIEPDPELWRKMELKDYLKP